MPQDDGAETSLEALQTLLETAHDLATNLCTDQQRDRLEKAFLGFPEADREAILRILEKEATWRRIVAETEAATGIRVQPNPLASLYVHVVEGAAADPVGPDTLRRDSQVIQFGIETFVRLVPLFFEDGVHAQWTAAARELARAGDPALRAAVARLAREVAAIADPEPSTPG